MDLPIREVTHKVGPGRAVHGGYDGGEGRVSFDSRVTGVEVQLPEKQHAKRTAAENKELTT